MLAGERHRKIVERVNSEGIVIVKDLAKAYGVTEDCIRKDLKILENKGLLTRIHGGATTNRENVHAYHAKDRREVHVEEKERIAAKAMTLLHDDLMIFLDISTSSYAIAQRIVQQHLRLTIVTNMVAILELLKDVPFVTLIFIGGMINHTNDGFTGSLTIDTLKKYRFDLAFVGVVGVDIANNQVMTYDMDDGLTKKQIMLSSAASYMLCEHEKFHQAGHFIYATIDDFTGLITDTLLSSQVEKALIAKDIDLV